MPLLDIQVKMDDNKVIYKFYSKPMSSKFTILANSAMPEKMKRNCLVQEGIRRLRNTSRSLGWELKAEILSEYSNKMRVSGYYAKYRLEVIQAAVRGFQVQCEKADKGVKPLHRPREFDSHSRWRKKCLTRYTWYRPHNSVLFVPCTPNGNLAREIQKVVSEETARLALTACTPNGILAKEI